MTIDEAYAELASMTGEDPETEHVRADTILMEFAPEVIQIAYLDASRRSGFWSA